MKFFSQLIVVLLLIAGTACSKEDEKKQSETPVAKTPADVINTETISINNARKALEDSRLVDKTIQDSAAEQRETIEKTQQ